MNHLEKKAFLKVRLSDLNSLQVQERHRGREAGTQQESSAVVFLIRACLLFSEVPMDECTYSSQPGGILVSRQRSAGPIGHF